MCSLPAFFRIHSPSRVSKTIKIKFYKKKKPLKFQKKKKTKNLLCSRRRKKNSLFSFTSLHFTLFHPRSASSATLNSPGTPGPAKKSHAASHAPSRFLFPGDHRCDGGLSLQGARRTDFWTWSRR